MNDEYPIGSRWVDNTSKDVWERREGDIKWKYLGRANSTGILDIISLQSHNASHDKDVLNEENKNP